MQTLIFSSMCMISDINIFTKQHPKLINKIKYYFYEVLIITNVKFAECCLFQKVD